MQPACAMPSRRLGTHQWPSEARRLDDRDVSRSPLPLRWLPWFASAGVLATGILWRDSVLIACGVAFALHAFNLQMDAGGPWPGWRVAIRCWAMGVASLIAGLTLGLVLLAAELDWWVPSNDRPTQVLWVLATATFACLLVRSNLPGKDFRLLADLLMPSAVVFALIASARGWEGVPCGFAALVALGVTHTGWGWVRSAGAFWPSDRGW